MNIETIREMIDRYLQGRATEQERKLIEKWLQARPEDNHVLEAQERQGVQHAIWQSFTQSTSWTASQSANPVSKLLRYRSWTRYAAAILMLICCATGISIFLFKKQVTPAQTIVAAPGSPQLIRLPDSSTAHLFPGATLTIPEEFNTTERAITLTGKVFFEVKSNPSKPFYVQTGKLKTLVLGTSFEVYAPDSVYTSVIVRTGKVAVQYDGRRLADLISGKRLRYNTRLSHLEIDEVNAALLCEWWNNGMVFNQSPLEEVVQSLSGWYNIPIVITNTKWKEETVTIRIKDRSFTEALSLLSATLGFQYKMENKKVVIY